MFLISILFCLGWGIFVIIVILPKFIYLKSYRNIDKQMIENIQTSSQRLLSINNGGIIGNIFYLTAGVFNIHIFKKGLIIKPLFYPKVYILKSEIKNISDWKGITTKGIKIEHNSEIIKNPIVIYTKNMEKIKDLLK